MTERPRKPAAFILDDAKHDKPRQHAGKTRRKPAAAPPVEVVETDDAFAPPTTAPEQPPAASRTLPRLFRFGRWLIGALGGLFTLWATVTLYRLVDDLFATHPWLGWTALALTIVIAVSAAAIILRELLGLLRLRRVTRLHEEAATALSSGDEAAMRRLEARLLRLYAHRDDMRWPIERLKDGADAVLSAEERLHLAERELLKPLDARAHAMIAATAQQVAVMTAVIPVATLDVLVVAAQVVRLLRRIATIYGGRPGWLGGWKLARMVVGHLALTGALALTDTLVQNILGKGLAGRLSARFGEGAVNGLLTARIGLAAIRLVRPLPHLAAPPPKLTEFVGQLLKLPDKAGS